MTHVIINRRYTQTQQLLGLVMHHITPYLNPNPESRACRDVARVLEELFHASGVQIITEADRAAAGLPPRDHNGMTLEELTVMEAHFRRAMLEGTSTILVSVDANGIPRAEQIRPEQ